jgi:hypothetical protein
MAYLTINSASGWGRISEDVRHGIGTEPQIVLPHYAWNRNVERGAAFIEFRLFTTDEKSADIRSMAYADVSVELNDGTVIRGNGMRNLICFLTSRAHFGPAVYEEHSYLVRFEGDEVNAARPVR